MVIFALTVFLTVVFLWWWSITVGLALNHEVRYTISNKKYENYSFFLCIWWPIILIKSLVKELYRNLNQAVRTYMIKESMIVEFQNNNKEHDIMGVVRTLFPNTEILVTLEKVKGKDSEV